MIVSAAKEKDGGGYVKWRFFCLVCIDGYLELRCRVHEEDFFSLPFPKIIHEIVAGKTPYRLRLVSVFFRCTTHRMRLPHISPHQPM